MQRLLLAFAALVCASASEQGPIFESISSVYPGSLLEQSASLYPSSPLDPSTGPGSLFDMAGMAETGTSPEPSSHSSSDNSHGSNNMLQKPMAAFLESAASASLTDTDKTDLAAFTTLKHHQESLQQMNELVVRQKESIRNTEAASRKLRSLISTNKAILAKNERALKAAGEQFLKDVQRYTKKLLRGDPPPMRHRRLSRRGGRMSFRETNHGYGTSLDRLYGEEPYNRRRGRERRLRRQSHGQYNSMLPPLYP
mmetsp:Transcript_16387/g.32054  ORF Transcript_16387/g.32054 Transcript_16387/m.32054 type:complete len:254 (+) Transcript_16387:27-788(+)